MDGLESLTPFDRRSSFSALNMVTIVFFGLSQAKECFFLKAHGTRSYKSDKKTTKLHTTAID